MRLHFATAAAIAALVLAAPTVARAEAAEATVVCKDGSTSKAGRGACRGHGGVDKAASAKAAGGTAAPAAEAKGKKARKSAEKDAAKAAKADEQGAETTVVCKDGSTSKGGRGACRGHGGVDRTATAKGAGAAVAPSAAPTPPPAAAAPRSPAAPAPAAATSPRPVAPSAAAAPPSAKNTDPAGAIARCKDGTYSHAKTHTGACSRHGGVAEWMDGSEKK